MKGYQRKYFLGWQGRKRNLVLSDQTKQDFVTQSISTPECLRREKSSFASRSLRVSL